MPRCRRRPCRCAERSCRCAEWPLRCAKRPRTPAPRTGEGAARPPPADRRCAAPRGGKLVVVQPERRRDGEGPLPGADPLQTVGPYGERGLGGVRGRGQRGHRDPVQTGATAGGAEHPHRIGTGLERHGHRRAPRHLGAVRGHGHLDRCRAVDTHRQRGVGRGRVLRLTGPYPALAQWPHPDLVRDRLLPAEHPPWNARPRWRGPWWTTWTRVSPSCSTPAPSSSSTAPVCPSSCSTTSTGRRA